MSEVNVALNHFIARLKANGKWEKTVIYIWSEFGRTNAENGSLGTDHGGATTGIVISPQVNGGVYGASYSSAEMQEQWLNVEYNHADILSEIVREVGYDPTPIFGNQSRSIGLFA